MEEKHLDAKGKGEYAYDFRNDILLFKVKDRKYLKSIDFDNLVIDIDEEGFITGIRIFDASKILKLPKIQLRIITQFEFNAKVEDKVITLQLRFTSLLRNKAIIKQGQDFIREALNENINNSEVLCTV